MELLAHLLYPGKHNNYHPHATRTPFLILVFLFLVAFGSINSVFFSSRPKILGFATNIYTKEVIDLTNKERVKAGLEVVKESVTLDKVAQAKAEDMFVKNYWAHASPEGVMPWFFFQKEEYHYLYAGENLARDFYPSGAVVAAWMASPSHKENLLSPNYQETGVAVMNGQFDGKDTTLIVQMFGTPLSSNVEVSQTEVEPRTASFFTSLSPEKKVQGLPIETLGLTQKVYLGFSLVLMAFFLFDSFILIKNQVKHRARHPFFHTILLGFIVFLIVYLNKGLIV